MVKHCVSVELTGCFAAMAFRASTAGGQWCCSGLASPRSPVFLVVASPTGKMSSALKAVLSLGLSTVFALARVCIARHRCRHQHNRQDH